MNGTLEEAETHGELAVSRQGGALPIDGVAPLESPTTPVANEKRGLLWPVRHVLSWAGIDRAVIYGILSVVRTILFGPVTVWLVALHFTPELQGYYYTFASLLALQVFVDLGLGTVIIQFASHEWSELSLTEGGEIVGSPKALSRLMSLSQVAIRWYGVASLIVAIGLGLAGYAFFSQTPNGDIRWVLPWLALCLLTGAQLWLVPIWSLLEGCNQVSKVYGFRFIQGILVSIATWAAIALGAKLWTASIAITVAVIYSIVFLRRRYWGFMRQIMAPVTGPHVSWRLEMWPLQWKIALSWVSGYFSYSLFTPMLFHYDGPVVAGQMGMTWSLISVLSAISSAWAMSKAPQFGIHIAKKEYGVLDRLFYKLTAASFLLAVCGALSIWLLIYFLYAFHYHLAERFLPPMATGLFLAATVLLQISIPQSFYLRAHKQEPFLWISIISGLLIVLANWLLGSKFSAVGVALGYLIVVALFSVPIGTFIWYSCRKSWHADFKSQTASAPEG